MDKHELFDKVCKQYGSLQNPNPPMRIDGMVTVGWHMLFERESFEDSCLIYLHVENGIGIADYKVKGYTPTPCCIYDGVDGQQAVNWFNTEILGLTLEDACKITFSTF